MVSLQKAIFRPAPTGRDAVSRLHCWPSQDLHIEPKPRADAVAGRLPKLPRRGRQSLRYPGGDETWVTKDEDLSEALGVTPCHFMFERSLRQLVWVPAIWVRIPLGDRDFDDAAELLPEITSIVIEHDLPEPHMVVAGDNAVVVLWHISPLRYPAALKAGATPAEQQDHKHQTWTFQKSLTWWRHAAIKLSFAFASVGVEPHTVATADQQLLEHIPFPLPAGAKTNLVAIKTFDRWDLPVLLRARLDVEPLRLKDISLPLKRYEAAMWGVYKRTRPGRTLKRRWLESQDSIRALATTGKGDRHAAAMKISSACVWDGLTEGEATQLLNDWKDRCIQDGTFPVPRQGKGGELLQIVYWCFDNLSPGGPTTRDGAGPNGKGQRPLSAIDHAAAQVLQAVVSAGGRLEATFQELARDAALIDEGPNAVPRPISRSTLKRALAGLRAARMIDQEVTRVGRTWRTTFILMANQSRPRPPTEHISKSIDLRPGQIGASEVQDGESRWVPVPDGFPRRGGSGDASPAGSGVRGEGRAANQPEESSLEDLDHPENHVPGESPSPETSRPPRQKPRRHRHKLKTAAGLTSAGVRRHRRRRKEQLHDGLPPVTSELVETVRPVLIDPQLRRNLKDAGLPDLFDDVALTELLKEARSRLRPHARFTTAQESFALAVKRAAQRILRWRCMLKFSKDREERAATYAQRQKDHNAKATRPALAASPQTLLASASAGPPGAGEEARTGFAAMAVRRPLHELHPIERARRLVDLGLSIIPLPPRSKMPAEESTWADAQRAPRHIAKLTRQLEAFGDDAGLAIICGAVSGVVAVDLDDETAVQWAKANLPETPWRTRTGRLAGGEHWFYALADGWRAPLGPLPYKGELQSTGKYVVAPGSIHPDTDARYAALGDWLAPKSSLPVFNNTWLLGKDAVRQARLRIVKDD